MYEKHGRINIVKVSLVTAGERMVEFQFDKDALLEFIWEAHQNTYAAPAEIRVLHKAASPLHCFQDLLIIFFLKESGVTMTHMLEENGHQGRRQSSSKMSLFGACHIRGKPLTV